MAMRQFVAVYDAQLREWESAGKQKLLTDDARRWLIKIEKEAGITG